MKYTPMDKFSVIMLFATGLLTLGFGISISKDVPLAVAIWILIVSCTIFVTYYTVVAIFIKKMGGKRFSFEREIDALRERVDAIEKRGLEE